MSCHRIDNVCEETNVAQIGIGRAPINQRSQYYAIVYQAECKRRLVYSSIGLSVNNLMNLQNVQVRSVIHLLN